MSSFTFTLTGNSTELSSTFCPEIVLDDDSNYSCGLLDFTTYHSIPNVSEKNRCLNYYKFKDGVDESVDIVNLTGEQILGKYDEKFGEYGIILIPTGTYEADEILQYLKATFETRGITFEYKINKNTLKTSIKCSADLIFGFTNSIHGLLGYNGPGIRRNTWGESQDIIRISNQDVIRIECNIVSGSYMNGKLCHSIYEFASNKVAVGYKLIEQPKNIIYLPVVQRRINNIQISITDQNGELIDFRGENIICRIHIKKDIN